MEPTVPQRLNSVNADSFECGHFLRFCMLSMKNKTYFATQTFFYRPTQHFFLYTLYTFRHGGKIQSLKILCG